MRIWIDLGNSPHVPFFLALSKEFERRGHSVLWTARDYAQTVELARGAGLEFEVFGTHGGKNILQKGLKFARRVLDLAAWARGKKIDLVVSHNSHEPLAAAKILGIKSVNLMDYEHHPANHLSFRLATRVIVPESFPHQALQKFGAPQKKVRRFAGLKEDVYLADFAPDEEFQNRLRALGIRPENVLVVIRPHAPEALYHRQYSNQILDEMIEIFAAAPNVKIILLPRKKYQGEALLRDHPSANMIIPAGVLDGANLIAAADLVVSGGGTMNREAAALGVPVATIFAGKPAAIDEKLVGEGRMLKIENRGDLDKIKLVKKPPARARRFTRTKSTVADLILSDQPPDERQK
jgi:predicted glycosyltransferase